MNRNAIRAGVLGATGYTGRELVRLLAGHPRARVVVATSESAAGRSLRGVERRAPEVELTRAEDAALDGCDVVFSCLPHGEGGAWVAAARRAGVRVVDLSADLRLPAEAGAGAAPGPGSGPASAPGTSSGAVYGLPELFRGELRCAELVANPGCYPTAVLVALAPLLRRGLVGGTVVVSAASGVTGAGRTAKRELLFGEVAEDFRAYGVGNRHRHVAEMRAHASRVAEQGGSAGSSASSVGQPDLVFTPHLLPVRRGILATMYVPLADAVEESRARAWWADDYAGEPFVDVLEAGVPSLADAVGTNRVVVGVSEVAETASPALLVVASMDNLLKGAAGQAVQNMNLCFGLPETEGLPC